MNFNGYIYIIFKIINKNSVEHKLIKFYLSVLISKQNIFCNNNEDA